ncbi:transglutaminaseTgpA domain-containing protein [Acinetobacter towneri]|uniref:transglutaminase family protein n=1 Tax=Acinetobacter towneri TaxID=202956 RepID=UPI0039890154
MHHSIQQSILLSLILILAAHMLFSPVALSVIIAIMLLLLYRHYKKKTARISKILTYGLTCCALVSIYLSYQSLIGIEAGVALLSTFLFAKALESHTQRDLIILFNFALFVSASSFLYSQSMWMTVLVILCLISCLIGLYRIQKTAFADYASRHSSSQDAKHDLKNVGKFISYALPFFLLLFLFFPRLPPLWHVPIPDAKGVTGISDTMSPGDIAELSQSSALAFRIVGNMQQLPPRSKLYWRAMVLDQYDGRTWTSNFSNQQPVQAAQLQPEQVDFQYQYIAADPRVQWIMALEKSVPNQQGYILRRDWSIVPQRQNGRIQPIALQWVGESAHIQGEDAQNERYQRFSQRLNVQVQTQSDPKAQQFALQMFAQSQQQPERYVQNILQWYRSNGFSYTLKPGTLGQNRVDEFLFQSKQGFCEHYASSFALLMRYVGIPARVVVGYQGGELAPDGQSWEVRQQDAHAWTEVLLNQQWVRIDPTAIIAPQRIDDGMQNLMADDRAVLGADTQMWQYQHSNFIRSLRVWSDYASYQWQSKVVGYDAESQRHWFGRSGLHSNYALAAVLVSSILLILAGYFGWIFWKKRQQGSRINRALDKFSKRLPAQLQKQDAETVSVWMQRLAAQVDANEQEAFKRLGVCYQQYTYAPEYDSTSEQVVLDLLKTCADVLKKHRKGLS